MNSPATRARLVLRASYAGVCLWQFIWHTALPPPAGNGSLLLGVLAALPLLLPLRGVWQGRPHGMIWGGLLLLVYFMVAAMEAWSNPAQRFAAWVQILLVTVYQAAVVILSRRPRPD